jgi:hypothetical protein
MFVGYLVLLVINVSHYAVLLQMTFSWCTSMKPDLANAQTVACALKGDSKMTTTTGPLRMYHLSCPATPVSNAPFLVQYAFQQYNFIVTESKPVVTAGAAAFCSDAWTAFPDGKCYIVRRAIVSWLDAEHWCREHNAHLASVHSAAVNTFLYGL